MVFFSLLAVPFSLAARNERPAAASAAAGGKQQQHAKPHYEFGGPLGASAMVLCLPVLVFGLFFACNHLQCVSLNPLSAAFLVWKDPLAGLSFVQFADRYLLSLEAVKVFSGWMALNVVLWYLPVGQVADGVPLDAKGTRLKYPLNGFFGMFASVGVMSLLAYNGYISPTIAYDQFTQLAFTATVFSFGLAGYLYASSLWDSRDNGRFLTPETMLAEHGHTGNALYDFFIGRSLNPRVFGLDLKYFCELRPGLVGWALINFSMAAKQASMGGVTNSMVIVIAFQAWYVYDALSSERAILTTMDITTDGFGWMLAFGDLAWVPFIYSTQARYLVDHPENLSVAFVCFILAVKAVGFWVFRGSNGQKNDFRTNPNAANVRHLKFLQTRSGSKLLISGWWGLARHMNYLGDLLMGLSWCLPCGFGSILPYFYFFYFAGLLWHRERRDEDKCSKKYGEDWKAYCAIVPYRIIPYIY